MSAELDMTMSAAAFAAAESRDQMQASMGSMATPPTPTQMLVQQQPASVETALPAWGTSWAPVPIRGAGTRLAVPPSASALGSPGVAMTSPVATASNAAPPMASVTVTGPDRNFDGIPDVLQGGAPLMAAIPQASLTMPAAMTSVGTMPSATIRSVSPPPVVRRAATYSPVLEHRAAPVVVENVLPITETIIRDPVPAQVVVEKVIEKEGMSTHEMQVWLQGERSRLSSAMQEIVGQQARTLTELINEEVHKVIHMVNAVSNSCEERLVRLEADRSARATAFQGLRRDFDSLQAQIADLEQARLMQGAVQDMSREREELMTVLDQVTQDVKTQHRNVLAGMSSQKEQQQRTEMTLAELRGDLETLVVEMGQHRNAVAERLSTVAVQKDLLSIQKDMQKIDFSFAELRRALQQSLDQVHDQVRTEFGNEVMQLRETLRAEIRAEIRAESRPERQALADRLTLMEAQNLDERLEELNSAIHAERANRTELAQTVDSNRVSLMQMCSELRAHLGASHDKLARVEVMANEDKGRDRSSRIEQSLNEFRNAMNLKVGEFAGHAETNTIMAKELQDLKRQVGAERASRGDLHNSLDNCRKAQLQTAAELRQELDLTAERLTRAGVEDRGARDRVSQLERTVADLRNTLQRRFTEVGSRLDSAMADSMASKDIEELTRLVREEGAARIGLSTSLNAYREAHQETTNELRADINFAMEKLTRLESQDMQAKGASAVAEMYNGASRGGEVFSASSATMQMTEMSVAPGSKADMSVPSYQDSRMTTPEMSRGASVLAGIARSDLPGELSAVFAAAGLAYPSSDPVSDGLGKAFEAGNNGENGQLPEETIEAEADMEAVLIESTRREDEEAAFQSGASLVEDRPSANEDELAAPAVTFKESEDGLWGLGRLGVASDVAEILADDRRLLGRVFGTAGASGGKRPSD